MWRSPGAVVPFVVAAVKAYGSSVLDKVRDGAADATADATVGAGRRVLRRLLGLGRVEEAVADLAEEPADEDRIGALRLQLRKAVAADPGLAAELAALVPSGPVAGGDRSAAVQHNTGIVQTGDGAQAWQQQRRREDRD